MEDAIPESIPSSADVATSIEPTKVSSSEPVNEDDDDDDPVVREINVYLSPELIQKLHIVQFPLIPQASINPRTESMTPDIARIRPQNKILEIEYPIDTSVFSQQRQIPEALNVGHRVYRSQNIGSTTHTAIGFMAAGNDALHLIPLVNDTMQMRPTFSHVDALFDDDADRVEEEANAKKKKDAKNSGSANTPLLLKKKESEWSAMMRRSSYAFQKAREEEEEWIDLDVHGQGTAELKEVKRHAHCAQKSVVNDTMQMRPTFSHVDALFDDDADRVEEEANAKKKKDAKNSGSANTPLLLKKKESEWSAMMRRSSYAFQKASEEEEEWIDLDVHGQGTAELKEVKRHAHCAQKSVDLMFQSRAQGGGKISGADANASEQLGYIKSLNYLPIIDEDRNAGMEGVGDDDASLRDLAARVTTILQTGVPAPLLVLRKRFPAVPVPRLLTALSGCAVLVRGNFVIKSSLCGLSPMVQRARDAILILMNKYGILQRELLVKFELPNVVLNHVLEKIACPSENCWEMKFEDDDLFAETYPEVATLYANYWKKRELALTKYIDNYENCYEEEEEEKGAEADPDDDGFANEEDELME
eukprot:CAMPEP_0194393272 /NCGR_PEP_ID=MMETSP0174-20130528/123207_1 /TAXON_ID=216777 /ORGANISM="Proboscia alata, Strain PI-D3" /LENGTH=588 /DNA_ID=CAMNT_0039188939 /DNA_START=39 /DNA_END=1805 /DNA_ORIENTATION=-